MAEQSPDAVTSFIERSRQPPRDPKVKGGVITVKPIEPLGDWEKEKQQVLDILLQSGDFDSILVAHEVGYTGKDHVQVGFANANSRYIDLVKNRSLLLKGGYEAHFEFNKANTKMNLANYISKQDPKPLAHNWDQWRSHAKRFTTDNRPVVDLYTVPAKEVKEMYSPPQAQRILQNRKQVLDEVAAEDYTDVEEMTFSFYDNEAPDVKLNFTYNYNTKVLTDPFGKQCLGIRCIWLVGETATSKTTQLEEHVERLHGYRVENFENWVGYRNQQLLCLNEFKGVTIKPIDLREALDATRRNVKYGSANVNPRNIWLITANYHPVDAWCDIYTDEQLCRISPTLRAIERCCYVIRLFGVYKSPEGGPQIGGGYITARRFVNPELLKRDRENDDDDYTFVKIRKVEDTQTLDDN